MSFGWINMLQKLKKLQNISKQHVGIIKNVKFLKFENDILSFLLKVNLK